MPNYLPRNLKEESPGAVSARFGMILTDYPRCCGMFILHSLPGSVMAGHGTNFQKALLAEIIDYLKGGALNLLIEENPIEGTMIPEGPVSILALALPVYGNDRLFSAAGWEPVVKTTNGIWSGKDMILFHKQVPRPTPQEREKWATKRKEVVE
jgi:hypothetical protein